MIRELKIEDANLMLDWMKNEEINIEKLTAGLYFIRISGHALRFIKE